jgi:hypothetical protein
MKVEKKRQRYLMRGKASNLRLNPWMDGPVLRKGAKCAKVAKKGLLPCDLGVLCAFA